MIKETCFTEEWLDTETETLVKIPSIDDAVLASAKVAHLAVKLLVNDMTPVKFYEGEDIRSLNIENPDYLFLNKLKRLADKSTFFYWHKTVQLLTSTSV